jgi:hypothetical protein
MKKNYYFVIIFLSTFLLNAQSSSNLDIKNGFNKFKLGSDISLHKSKLKFDAKDKNNVSYYIYIGKDINSVYGVKVQEILVGYYKNKLYTISVEFGSIENNISGKIIKELNKIFGEEEIEPFRNSETFEYEWVITWSTNNVHLQMNKMSCSFEFKPCVVAFFLISKPIQKKIEMDKF